MTDDPLVVPLPPDCEYVRQDLLRYPVPPLWELGADEARALHREGSPHDTGELGPPDRLACRRC